METQLTKQASNKTQSKQKTASQPESRERQSQSACTTSGHFQNSKSKHLCWIKLHTYLKDTEQISHSYDQTDFSGNRTHTPKTDSGVHTHASLSSFTHANTHPFADLSGEFQSKRCNSCVVSLYKEEDSICWAWRGWSWRSVCYRRVPMCAYMCVQKTNWGKNEIIIFRCTERTSQRKY